MNPIVMIPSRLGSTRLPQKALRTIQGFPMIIHVWKRAIDSGIGRVVVATCGEEIASVIRATGGEVFLTDPDLPSGTDRIQAVLAEIDPHKKHDVVVNLQGDLPFIDPQILKTVLVPLEEKNVDIGTLAAVIDKPEDIQNQSVVKIALAQPEKKNNVFVGRGLYFSRNPIPANGNLYYHHIGVYSYTREALDRFVSLPPSPLEMCEKLEQLRALENNFRIDVALVDHVPQSVDTEEDLKRLI